MNLLHMNYFIAVVEHQSISRAAQSLFITQQTLSSHIASMEKELGTCLFERRPRFRLTRTGERFYQMLSILKLIYIQNLEELFQKLLQGVIQK